MCSCQGHWILLWIQRSVFSPYFIDLSTSFNTVNQFFLPGTPDFCDFQFFLLHLLLPLLPIPSHLQDLLTRGSGGSNLNLFFFSSHFTSLVTVPQVLWIYKAHSISPNFDLTSYPLVLNPLSSSLRGLSSVFGEAHQTESHVRAFAFAVSLPGILSLWLSTDCARSPYWNWSFNDIFCKYML